jgi:hypothetical protein
MLMKSGDRWHCSNPACPCAMLVERSGEIAGSYPRCVCGSILKKEYAPPIFHYLDFLHFGQPRPNPGGTLEAREARKARKE